jgi:hypothetical protein
VAKKFWTLDLAKSIEGYLAERFSDGLPLEGMTLSDIKHEVM